MYAFYFVQSRAPYRQSNAWYWDEASRMIITAIRLDTLLARTGYSAPLIDNEV
jgi:hypothetical protein